MLDLVPSELLSLNAIVLVCMLSACCALSASRYIMSFNRESETNVMAVRICMGIPFQLLIAIIYYGPQSDIQVKSIARRNTPESSMINFERRDRLLGLFGDPV